MKKILMLTVILSFCSSLMKAGNYEVKYCLNYADFVANRWTPIESLTNGHTKQVCQLKFQDDQYRVKTGDKEIDNYIKKNVLAIEYGGHLYVNCRNLRCKDIPLDVNGFSQAYRYDGNKLCVVAHWINGGVLAAALVGDVVTIAAPLPVALPAAGVSTAAWLSLDKMSQYRCYLLDSNADDKGKFAVTRITDEVMGKILDKNHGLFERYMTVEKKGNRQTASNILPILFEQGLVKDL